MTTSLTHENDPEKCLTSLIHENDPGNPRDPCDLAHSLFRLVQNTFKKRFSNHKDSFNLNIKMKQSYQIKFGKKRFESSHKSEMGNSQKVRSI